jgi:hypothetical protein
MYSDALNPIQLNMLRILAAAAHHSRDAAMGSRMLIAPELV